jgi:hypothetical protein
MGLYHDNVVEGAESSQPASKKPLTTMTNVDLVHRKKDFGSQFEMTDKSPTVTRSGEKLQDKKVEQNLAKVIKGISSSWDVYDEPPESSKKENVPRKVNSAITRRDPNTRHWGFEEDE